MSAVENDEHTESTKTIETEGVPLVVEETTTHLSKDTIPDGIASEHAHLSENHVASTPSAETAANELSSDDTRGEATVIGHTEEIETTQEHAIATEQVTEIHSTSATEYISHEDTTTAATTEDSQMTHEEVEPTFDMSSKVDAFKTEVETASDNQHNEEVVRPDAAAEAVNVSALHGVETLIDDTNGEPIMVTENAVEVCEAEPELLTSSITSANGLLMLNENALEVCEAEPTLSPSPSAETSVQSEEISASIVVEHTSVAEESLVEEVEPVSATDAAEEERVSEDAHTTPEEPPVVTEEESHEAAVEPTTGHAAVEATYEVIVEETAQNHDSVEEVVASQVEDKTLVLENGDAVPTDQKDEQPDEVVEAEPASAEVSALANGAPEEQAAAKEEIAVEEDSTVEEVEAKEEAAVEHVSTEDAAAQEEVVAQEETAAQEVAAPKAEVVEPLMAEADMLSLANANVDSEHLVLLTSSSETCIADPQLDGEFGNGEAVSFMHSEQPTEHEIAPATEEIVSETVVSSVDTQELVVEQETSTSSHVSGERDEVTPNAVAEPVAEKSLPSEAIDTETAVAEAEEAKDTAEAQEVREAVQEAESSASLDAAQPVSVISAEIVTEEVIEKPTEQTVEAKEDLAESSVVAETSDVVTEVQPQVDVQEVAEESTAVSAEVDCSTDPEATVDNLTLLAQEETAVCESEVVEAGHDIVEAEAVEVEVVETNAVEDSAETKETSAVAEEEIEAKHELAKVDTIVEPTVGETIIAEATSEADAAAPVIAVTAEASEEFIVSSEPNAEPKESDSEAARPASPWTPSYSVTTQGPGTETEVADDAEELTALEKLPSAEEPPAGEHTESGNVVAIPEDATHATEGSNKGWSLSYSVSSQGASPLQAPQASDDTEVELMEPLTTQVREPENVEQQSIPEVVTESSFVVPKVQIVEEDVQLPAIVTTDETEVSETYVEKTAEEVQEASEESEQEISVAQVVSEQTVEEAAAVEQSTTPEHIEHSWTPSYSVDHVGASPSLAAKELDVAPQEQTETSPEVVVSTEKDVQPTDVERQAEPSEPAATAPVEIPERPWTPSYSVSQQGRSPISPSKGLEEPAASEPPAEIPAVVATETQEESAPARPWTPSYSVSRQGSGSSPVIPSQTLESEPSAEPPAEQPVEQPVEQTAEPAPAVLVTEDKEIAPERPWTPSYSVSNQGSSPIIIAKEVEASAPTMILEEGTVIREEPAPERPWTPSYSVSRQGSSPQLTPAQPAAVETTDAPQRPWTPSYSVSRQGSSPLSPAQELPQADAVVPPAQPEPVAATQTPRILIEQLEAAAVTDVETASTEANSTNWVPSYSVNQQGSPVASPVSKPKALDASEPVFNSAADGVTTQTVETDRSERNWTASYSVTSQGPSSATEPTLHTFPTTEVSDNAPKPSLARLASVNELEQSAASTAELDMLSPTTQRARLESTTSSRFFPGGWFSGSPKSPNENRTSLDHAIGEFSRADNLSASPGQDVPLNTPVDGEEDSGRKRWCLIM
ncbi:hypothetical protein EIP86_002230 [Pleurotus ostreatoroseus]|nr:hypothetical protein EIP86_002230 [Pleurotus ostreatoroseus]